MIEITRIISPEEVRPLVREFLEHCTKAGSYRKEWMHESNDTTYWAFEKDGDPFIVSLDRAVDGFMAFVTAVATGLLNAIGVTMEQLKDTGILLGASLAPIVLEYCLGVRKA